jgi:hypothetical protein
MNVFVFGIPLLLGLKDEHAIRIARLSIMLSLPMYIGFLGFLSYLAYVPGLDGIGLHRLSGFYGFFGFSGFLGMLGYAAMIELRTQARGQA